ncbi:MAG: hypothetical protein CBC42_07035 [Betaproteobacteria bacterium TMED82]|nr:MAG: hypothetical protein CBC42_07035 [Betaproteobacteria bacterium TMED82]|tara:strand:- start:14463 stop:15278 length:816 start_codon:yes stop_codon:yes gene_type:complete
MTLDKFKKEDCFFCKNNGGKTIFKNRYCRTIIPDDGPFQMHRVVWNSHVREFGELNNFEAEMLFTAIKKLEKYLYEKLTPDKINIISMGNITPHLHIHVVPRWKTDPWWPNFTWNTLPRLTWRRSAFENKIHIAVTSWNKGRTLLQPIREEVFIKEQNIPKKKEWDEFDPISRHVLIKVGQKIVGTGRLNPRGRLGRICVLKTFRKRGLGNYILQALVSEAKKLNYEKIYLHSQKHAVSFYQKKGFQLQGKSFIECKSTHFKMFRSLDLYI